MTGGHAARSIRARASLRGCRSPFSSLTLTPGRVAAQQSTAPEAPVRTGTPGAPVLLGSVSLSASPSVPKAANAPARHSELLLVSQDLVTSAVCCMQLLPELALNTEHGRRAKPAAAL